MGGKCLRRAGSPRETCSIAILKNFPLPIGMLAACLAGCGRFFRKEVNEKCQDSGGGFFCQLHSLLNQYHVPSSRYWKVLVLIFHMRSSMQERQNSWRDDDRWEGTGVTKIKFHPLHFEALRTARLRTLSKLFLHAKFIFFVFDKNCSLHIPRKICAGVSTKRASCGCVLIQWKLQEFPLVRNVLCTYSDKVIFPEF